MKLSFNLPGRLVPPPPSLERRTVSTPAAAEVARALLRAEGAVEPGADRFQIAEGLRALLRQRWPFESAKVICCVGKGGAGKSTATVQFAVIAAHMGFAVLVLDLDRQRSVSGWSRIRGEDANITVRACGYNDAERACRTAQAEGYDLVLIDHPQQPGEGWPGVVRVTNLFILLSRPSIFDLTTAQAWLRHLEAHKVPHLTVVSSAPPRHIRADNPAVRDVREELTRRTGWMWGGQITSRQSIITATAQGKGIIEVDRYGPGSAEYIVLWHRICGRLRKGERR